MSFMAVPTPGLVPSSVMNEAELDGACEHVDDLTRVGVYKHATKPLQNNCPLFLVEKTLGANGLPSSFRCIADTKKGRQNDICVSDPSHMASIQDILPRLCLNGWSAVSLSLPSISGSHRIHPCLEHGGGSGTGTGGTQKFVHALMGDRPSLVEVWMGTWSLRSPSSTSNWKERRRLYYCTMTTVSPMIQSDKESSKSLRLPALIMRLKILELQHNCMLVVIHIPGLAMNDEGTAGQSRGIWAYSLTISGS